MKYEEVYLKAYQDGRDARVEIREYFRFYNAERPHQALGYRTPAEVFMSRLVEATHGNLVESLKPDTLTTEPQGAVGPSLNVASASPTDGVRPKSIM